MESGSRSFQVEIGINNKKCLKILLDEIIGIFPTLFGNKYCDVDKKKGTQHR